MEKILERIESKQDGIIKTVHDVDKRLVRIEAQWKIMVPAVSAFFGMLATFILSLF